MPDPYYSCGKQVLRGSIPVCDAATPEVAEEIVRAMNQYDRMAVIPVLNAVPNPEARS